ncbi:MAG: outer membrane lipoprotein-sorting protein [Desulfosarcinaceae bacterium]|nr:outer membrane lipoprotein-sorting protein [Desulfosarcinaceae bacterium]
MRRWFWIPLIMVLGPVLPLAVQADDPKARAIMQQVEDRDDGDHQTGEMQMRLIDRHGNERLRQIRTFAMDKGEDTHRLMFFLHPADVKDTGFLTYDYDDPDADDDQWLYLPALRKTKRIATSDKSGSFMGSDLTYADMTSRDLEDYDYTLKKELTVRGHDAWLIEALPREKTVIAETGYTKSLLIVRKDIDMVVRAVHWVKDGGYLKYVDATRLEEIDGIWVATELKVALKKGKQTVHRTVLNLENVRFNQNLDPAMFSTRRLEKGL